MGKPLLYSLFSEWLAEWKNYYLLTFCFSCWWSGKTRGTRHTLNLVRTVNIKRALILPSALRDEIFPGAVPQPMQRLPTMGAPPTRKLCAAPACAAAVAIPLPLRSTRAFQMNTTQAITQTDKQHITRNPLRLSLFLSLFLSVSVSVSVCLCIRPSVSGSLALSLSLPPLSDTHR